MNILKTFKSKGTWAGPCLFAALMSSGVARAEVALVEKDGWIFSFDGRVNSFLSGGQGNAFPLPHLDPSGNLHKVMGSDSSAGQGIGDVGWPSSQQDPSNNFQAVRIRSGMFGNILGFALTRNFSDTSSIRGYVSIWSTVETLGRDKWAPVTAEAREGYFTATGTWGSVTVGRMLGQLGRTSYEIDVKYGHGYGVGLPCTDALGPACGHIGTGALFPGYSAGMSYSTPSLAGLQLHAGVYDPVVFNPGSPNDWSHASLVRPEGAVTFDRPLGARARIKIGVEGLYQQIGRIHIDPTTMVNSNVTSSVWGVSGGVRLEVGPLRLGGSAFRGRGIGLGTALQRSVATSDNDASNTAPGGLTYGLRTFTGYYGQAALVAGGWQLAAGYGLGIVDQLPVDKLNTHLSVFHTQLGVSAAVYYRISDSVVLGLDYFRYLASWYGAPLGDATGMPIGGHLAGERQVLNFVNAGATYRW